MGWIQFSQAGGGLKSLDDGNHGAYSQVCVSIWMGLHRAPFDGSYQTFFFKDYDWALGFDYFYTGGIYCRSGGVTQSTNQKVYPQPEIGRLHHWLAIFDNDGASGEKVNLYRDGELLTANSSTSNSVTAGTKFNNTQIGIGCSYDGSRPIDAIIGEWAILCGGVPTVDEIRRMALGESPRLVRPDLFWDGHDGNIIDGNIRTDRQRWYVYAKSSFWPVEPCDLSPIRRRGFLVGAIGGQSIAGGLASETNTAFAITGRKARSIGLASSVDSALAASARRDRLIDIATETETAQAIGRARAKTVDLPSSGESAHAATWSRAKAAGLASELETALAASHARAGLLGRADESNEALPVGVNASHPLGIAIETETAQTVGRARAKTVELSSSSESAPAATWSRAKAAGLASELDAALAAVALRARSVEIAVETDIAIAATHARGQAVGLSAESALAFAVAHSRARAIGPALEYDIALALVIAVQTGSLARPPRPGATPRAGAAAAAGRTGGGAVTSGGGSLGPATSRN